MQARNTKKSTIVRKIINEEIEMNTDVEANLSVMGEVGTVVTRWIAAFNAHDVGQIVALYSDDAELFDTGMRYRRKGYDEIKGWFTERFQKMPTIRYTPTKRFFERGEAVVCWVAKGRTPAILGQRWLSRPFEVEGVSVFVVSAGRIRWQHGYYDHLYVVGRVLPLLRWLPLRL